MQGNQQQAYDRGSTIFSPDGRLYQVEYAREAVKRGSPTVGVRTPEGIALAAAGRTRSSLQVPESVEKIHEADAHVGIATAGHAADGRRLVDVARREAQVERLRYDQPVGVETLTKTVTDHVQERTQTGGARPYGAALLVGGVDGGPGGTPRLFETDPSGTPYEWRAVAIGGDSGEIRDYLEAEFDADLSLDEGVDLALSALAESGDGGLDPRSTSAATVPVETGEYERTSVGTIRERVEALGLDAAS
ncbi:archaeal proteasome endopeptidase complex subunit alpha [Salinirubellus sp. GCM10025818]|uniref:archaeal proteasome endopeptidase complex subunit alpha n=1 Tax=Salinirubellus TaxID=2162630 RepID=UPI0030D18D87